MGRENSSESAGQCTGSGEIDVALETHRAHPVPEPVAPASSSLLILPAPDLFQSTSGRGTRGPESTSRKASERESPAEPSQSSSEKSKEKLTSN